eukprot:54752-Prorocentrum_minimum.AAC.1
MLTCASAVSSFEVSACFLVGDPPPLVGDPPPLFIDPRLGPPPLIGDPRLEPSAGEEPPSEGAPGGPSSLFWLAAACSVGFLTGLVPFSQGFFPSSRSLRSLSASSHRFNCDRPTNPLGASFATSQLGSLLQ